MTEFTINCGTRLPNLDQSWGATIDRTINRSISCDRSLRPTTDRTINRGNSGTKRPIVRSIVASCDRSYNQSCDYRAASIHNCWCYHAPLVVRARRTDCELSTETCSKNVYSIGPLCLLPENRLKCEPTGTKCSR